MNKFYCDGLSVYLREITKYPLLSIEEEWQLHQLLHHGDAQQKLYAKEKFIKSNLRLVVRIAYDFTNKVLPILELVSAGNVGLMRAVELFDPSKGAKFSSYAAWWIKQAMRRVQQNSDRVIRIPIQTGTKIAKINRCIKEFNLAHGRTPSDAEISALTGFTKRTITNFKTINTDSVVSLNAPLQEGENCEYSHIISDPQAPDVVEEIVQKELMQELTQHLYLLEKREQKILILRYGLFGNRLHTLDELSLKINRTRERVRQIQNQALSKLKNRLTEQHL